MLNVLKLIRENSMKSRLLLQVHDELIFEIAPNEDAAMEKLVREAMASAYALNVPLEDNVGFGKSWDLAAH
jgi:DNA polymerase-1